MSKAFVMIHCTHNQTKLALDELKKLDFVTEITPVYGVYDIIIEIEASLDDRIVCLSQIRKIKSIQSTLTLPGVMD